jgi:hypothetical protein
MMKHYSPGNMRRIIGNMRRIKENMRRIPVFGLAALVLAGLAGCASAPPPARDSPAAPPPWVLDKNAAYPDSGWLCVVEQGPDKKAAESAALSALAQVFRVNLNAVTSASQQFAQMSGAVDGKESTAVRKSINIAQELVSVSSVSGLIGVELESWDDGNGRAYANARMNRRECSARYAAMIQGNEEIITQLKDQAAGSPATFEAWQMLNFAVTAAALTDNLHSLLTVLDPASIEKRPGYGNAEAVKTLAQNAARSIVITVQVSGDQGGRLAKAFADFFSSRGFRTTAAGETPYQLEADFSMEDAAVQNQTNKFVRYVLNCSLKNKAGVEILSHSENDREGHAVQAEAVQRAVRAAEASIGGTAEAPLGAAAADKSRTFAAKFDAYLASLL